jgi:hypothetical protein
MAKVLTAIPATESNIESLKKKSRSAQSEMIFAHVRDWFDFNMFKLSFSSEGSRRRAG